MIEAHGVRFELLVPDGWELAPTDDDAAASWVHPSGLRLVAKARVAERARIEVTVLPAETIATAPAPRLRVSSSSPLLPWLGGASAEIVALTDAGPVLATQLRGFAVGAPDALGILPEPLVVAPGHPAASVWRIEHLEGDLLTTVPEPSWLPPRRHVPYGDEVVLTVPDGVVTGVEYVEHEDGFLLNGPPGLHTAEVGGPRGISLIEVGWHLDWDELVRRALEGAPDDLRAHLLLLLAEPDPDDLERPLGKALEEPTLWSALAAAAAAPLGLTTVDDAREAARAVLPGADVATRVALVSRGLADVSCLVGVQLGRVAFDGLARFGMGRAVSAYPDGAERDLAPAWFWLAGLGESERAARVGGIVAHEQARALCRASQTFDPEAVAWLSLFA